MQRAMAMFPHDAAKRIVLVTDGNQNVGDALEEARAIADAGVSIDVMPVPLDQQSEVAVEKIALPADVRRNQPFELRVVVNNDSDRRSRRGKTGEAARSASCARRASARKRWSMSRARSSRARRVFPFRQEIDQRDFYTYEAQFRAGRRGERRALAKQPGHGVHARARQRAGAAHRGLGERRASSTIWSSGCGTKGWKSSCSRATGCSRRCPSCSVTTR